MQQPILKNIPKDKGQGSIKEAECLFEQDKESLTELEKTLLAARS